jgi:hypothetical protein
MGLISRKLLLAMVLWSGVASANSDTLVKIAVFGDLQAITDCRGPAATSWATGVAAYDWVASQQPDAAIILGDMVQTQPVGTPIDCECYGTVDPGNCGDIDHSIWGTGYCPAGECGEADAITCTGGTPGLYCAWERARALVDKLDVAGIPWITTPGNHDCDIFLYNPNIRCANGAAWTVYDSYFGPGRLTGNSLGTGWYRGKVDTLLGKVDAAASSYVVVEAQGQRFLIISVHYMFPDGIVDWVNSVIAKYPGVPTILISHVMHERTNLPNGWTNDNGAAFLSNFGPIPQIYMHIAGHIWRPISFEDTSNEYRVLGQTMDYSYTGTVIGTTLAHQDQDYGGGGAVAMMSIDIVAGQVSWYIYSPAEGAFDVFYTDENTRSFWSEEIQFCGTSGRFKMDEGACVGYREPTSSSGIAE